MTEQLDDFETQAMETHQLDEEDDFEKLLDEFISNASFGLVKADDEEEDFEEK